MGHNVQRKMRQSEQARQQEVDRLLDRAGLEVTQSPEGFRAIRIKPAVLEQETGALRCSQWRRVR